MVDMQTRTKPLSLAFVATCFQEVILISYYAMFHQYSWAVRCVDVVRMLFKNTNMR